MLTIEGCFSVSADLGDRKLRLSTGGSVLSDTNDTARNGVEVDLKDALLIVPLASSCLAITWEVGYFWSLKGGSFGLFTLAEHITFAVQALPLAICLSVVWVLSLAYGKVSRQLWLRSINQKWP